MTPTQKTSVIAAALFTAGVATGTIFVSGTWGVSATTTSGFVGLTSGFGFFLAKAGNDGRLTAFCCASGVTR
jgi:hypothetical protein